MPLRVQSTGIRTGVNRVWSADAMSLSKSLISITSSTAAASIHRKEHST